MITQYNDQELFVFSEPHRHPDTHCITKNHLLCTFFLFFFFFLGFLLEFVTRCVAVKSVSLTAVKVLGENQCLPDFKCFHGVPYVSV